MTAHRRRLGVFKRWDGRRVALCTLLYFYISNHRNICHHLPSVSRAVLIKRQPASSRLYCSGGWQAAVCWWWAMEWGTMGGAVGWMPTSCCSGLWLLAGKSWVWFWILVCVCVHVYMYMPVGTKADIGCLPQWLSLWFFCFFCFLKQGLSMMVKVTKSTRLVDQTAPWTLLSPPLQCRDYRSALSDLWAGAGELTQVFSASDIQLFMLKRPAVVYGPARTPSGNIIH